jgi:hypothetical protein
VTARQVCKDLLELPLWVDDPEYQRCVKSESSKTTVDVIWPWLLAGGVGFLVTGVGLFVLGRVGRPTSGLHDGGSIPESRSEGSK